MSTLQNNLHQEIKALQQKELEEKALKNYKRNRLGILISALLLLLVMWLMITGMSVGGNFLILLLFISVLGLFYFKREMSVIRKGLLFSSAVFIFTGGLIAILYTAAQLVLFDGMDKLDWLLTVILIFGPVIQMLITMQKARKED